MPVMTTIHPSILSPLLQWWTVVSWMTSLTEQSALPRGLCMELQQATHATLGTGWLGMAQGSAEQTGGGVGGSQAVNVCCTVSHTLTYEKATSLQITPCSCGLQRSECSEERRHHIQHRHHAHICGTRHLSRRISTGWELCQSVPG